MDIVQCLFNLLYYIRHFVIALVHNTKKLPICDIPRLNMKPVSSFLIGSNLYGME